MDSCLEAAGVKCCIAVQAFWRLQPAPEGDSVFHVRLAFPAALAPDRTVPQGRAAAPVPPFEHIRITPGFSGSVVTSVMPPKQLPTVQVPIHTASRASTNAQTP
jgi:hypothetical protein